MAEAADHAGRTPSKQRNASELTTTAPKPSRKRSFHSCNPPLTEGSSTSLQPLGYSGFPAARSSSSIDTLTKRRLDELSSLFLEDYKSGKLEPRGWPTDRVYAAYQASKALVSAYTRILARENPALRVNRVHPGYVETEMNCNTGDLTAAEGARVSVAVALADQGGVTGAYFDRTEIASFV